MDVDGDAVVTPRTVLMAGELLVAASASTAAAVLVYFACSGRPRALRSITDDFRSFANDCVPYIIGFSVCWYLSVAFEKSIASSRLVAVTTSEYYLPCKLLLNVTAFVTKHYLFSTRSSYHRTALFVANIALVATSEAMSHEKREQTATRVTRILLFWLTVLILVRRVTTTACYNRRYSVHRPSGLVPSLNPLRSLPPFSPSPLGGQTKFYFTKRPGFMSSKNRRVQLDLFQYRPPRVSQCGMLFANDMVDTVWRKSTTMRLKSGGQF